MNRNDFYEHIKEGFFAELTADFEGFKSMITSALPIFGELETEIKTNEDGTKTIDFYDVDEAQFVLAPKGVDEVDTNMTSKALTIHLDKDNIITIVEHGFGLFTPANKKNVLLLASFIGKKIDFN